MPIKDVKMVKMQSKCSLYSSLILSVFECPGDFLDFMPKQEDLNIMNMSS